MKRIVVLSLFFLVTKISFSSTISGFVTDEKGVPLPYASVFVKGTSQGTTANKEGKYLLQVEHGTQIIVCQHVGYERAEKSVIINAENLVLNFQLNLRELVLSEVVLVKGEDPANEIIRQAIRKRKFYNEQLDSFSVDVYVKGLLRSDTIPKKVFKQKIDRSDFSRNGLDSTGKGILFLSESMTKVSVKQKDQLKYEVVASRQSGGGPGFNFPFFINFYENNVAVFNNALNQRGFVSPIADGAFNFYRYRFIGNFFEDGKMINRIQVFPKRKNEPLFSGFIEICEDDWRIYSVDFLTTQQYALEILDSFRITQIHVPVSVDEWRVKDQVVFIALKQMGFAMNGNFVNVYTNYNLTPTYTAKKFDRVVLKYDSAFNQKDSMYWTTVRPIPLEKEETKNFVFKDSVAKTELTVSKKSRDSLQAQEKPISIKEIFWSGGSYRFYGEHGTSTYQVQPFLKQLAYNTVEGAVLNFEQVLQINNSKKANYEINWQSRYGVNNRHFNSFIDFTIRRKGREFRNSFISLGGGKQVVQFNEENPTSESSNTRHTLLEKENYLKLYEKWVAKSVVNKVFENGLRVNAQIRFENRKVLQNTTDFTFFNKSNLFTPNHPQELAAIPFVNHQAFLMEFTFNYQPGQRFIQFPNRKIPVGSKMAMLELMYTKGIKNIFGSDVDFDKWKFSVIDDINFKLIGEFRYRLSVGGFLNNRQVAIPDMHHLLGSQSKIIRRPLNSFWLAPYYLYSNTEKFYAISHIEHHFNGLLSNKIPLMNKLKINLVVGSNNFYGSKANYYTDFFIGVENIFKVLRVDWVTATQSKLENSSGIKIGLGGLLGKTLSTSRNSVSLSF
ncbi:MAG: carboxypeptidase-like regulatory domain-containing protein [Chitinophagaceae bacterium]|nr:MAG: carboxypeptidase-like regulatory domain-containing protein [Chitinophagaceae bacterium]